MSDCPRGARTGLLLAASLLASSTGCGFTFVRGTGLAVPLGDDPPSTSHCSGSDAVTIVDSVLGTAAVVAGTAVIVGGAESKNPKGNEGWVIAGGAFLVAVGGLSIAAAATGYDRKVYCGRLQAHARSAPPPPDARPRHLLDVGALAQARDGP
jgi:hypothetical protein